MWRRNECIGKMQTTIIFKLEKSGKERSRMLGAHNKHYLQFSLRMESYNNRICFYGVLGETWIPIILHMFFSFCHVTYNTEIIPICQRNACIPWGLAFLLLLWSWQPSRHVVIHTGACCCNRYWIGLVSAFQVTSAVCLGKRRRRRRRRWREQCTRFVTWAHTLRDGRSHRPEAELVAGRSPRLVHLDSTGAGLLVFLPTTAEH